MRRRDVLAVIGTIALLLVPTAWTFSDEPVVAGHTTYADMDGLDPCIAGIVGIVRLRVMWFNDQVLFERSAQDGSSWVYAVQGGAPDPREAMLTPTGTEYPMTDPNGIEWVVKEYAYRAATAAGVNAGEYEVEPTSSTPVVVEEEPSYHANTDGAEYHAWVVQTGPTIEDFSATGRPYNFVDLVDTCKFTEDAAGTPVQHTSSGGNWSSSWGNDTTEQAHFADDPTHGHDRFSVDLYVGKAPKVEFVYTQDPAYLGVPS